MLYNTLWSIENNVCDKIGGIVVSEQNVCSALAGKLFSGGPDIGMYIKSIESFYEI